MPNAPRYGEAYHPFEGSFDQRVGDLQSLDSLDFSGIKSLSEMDFSGLAPLAAFLSRFNERSSERSLIWTHKIDRLALFRVRSEANTAIHHVR